MDETRRPDQGSQESSSQKKLSTRAWTIIFVAAGLVAFFFFVPVIGSSSSGSCVNGTTECNDNVGVSLTLAQALWQVLASTAGPQ